MRDVSGLDYLGGRPTLNLDRMKSDDQPYSGPHFLVIAYVKGQGKRSSAFRLLALTHKGAFACPVAEVLTPVPVLEPTSSGFRHRRNGQLSRTGTPAADRDS